MSVCAHVYVFVYVWTIVSAHVCMGELCACAFVCSSLGGMLCVCIRVYRGFVCVCTCVESVVCVQGVC